MPPELRAVDETVSDDAAAKAAVLIDLKSGEATVTIRTNDLTHDYVHENSAYSS